MGVMFATKGANRRIAVTDLEAQIVAPTAIEAALCMRLTGNSKERKRKRAQ